MQLDFHYGVIRILTQKAGFSPYESQLIAYASQYVDDAVEHKPLKLPYSYDVPVKRLEKDIFNPICAAHKGLQFLKDFKKDVQEKIYLSFHFLPPEVYNGQKNYSYLVKPNGNLANLLLKKVLNQLEKNRNEENLIGLGIALHSFADTWSHSCFSGVYSPKDNDIEKIKIYDGKKLKEISPLRQFSNNLLPSIGHAEASNYPDYPFLKWSFVKANDMKNEIVKDNPLIFMQAAETIYNILCRFNKCQSQWNELQKKLWIAFNFISYDEQERLNFLRKNFFEISFYYDENLWKNEVLNPPTFADKNIKFTPSLHWFYFHNKAYEQRLFVLSKIKRLADE